jgi:hypothetical protein
MRGKSRELALQKGRKTFGLISLFLTNAIREAWEEIGLNPFNVRYLGALPSYELSMYRRTIFPLVAFMPDEQNLRPNYEVERIVEIPLDAFLDESSYGRFTAVSAEGKATADEDANGAPCLVHRDHNGKEEILWGATFFVIMSFLKTVIGFRPPEPLPERIVKKILPPHYTSGRC